jgi:hypothetical protein
MNRRTSLYLSGIVSAYAFSGSLGSLAIYFEFGSDNFKSKDANDEEE